MIASSDRSQFARGEESRDRRCVETLTNERALTSDLVRQMGVRHLDGLFTLHVCADAAVIQRHPTRLQF